MTKVLVTGGSGFIGQHLVQALTARGDEVTCLVRQTSQVEPLQKLGAKLIYGDVTSAESLPPAVADAEVIYHLAGLTKATRAADLLAVNEQGVRNLFSACARRESPPVVVLISSLAAAGPSTRDRARTESDPPQPVSNYGRSKLAGERAAIEWSDRIPTTIVRPPIVYGEGDAGLLGLFKPIARLGVHVVAGLGRSRFSFVHAGDLSAALILAAERGRRVQMNGAASSAYGPAGIYFAAGEEQPSWADFGRMIGEALGRRSVLVCPSWNGMVLWPSAIVAEAAGRIRGRPFIYNFDKAREAQAGSWHCATDTIRQELGFVPAVPIRDGLRRTADWYRRNGWL